MRVPNKASSSHNFNVKLHCRRSKRSEYIKSGNKSKDVDRTYEWKKYCAPFCAHTYFIYENINIKKKGMYYSSSDDL